MSQYSSDFQGILQMEAGTFFKTSLWKEWLKELAKKRKILTDQLETTRLNDEKKVFDFVRIQGQLEGIDENLYILEKIVNFGILPGVTQNEFPRFGKKE